MDRPALEDVDENAAETEAKGNEVHEPDTADVVLVFSHDFGVEEQEGVLDCPIAEEVKYAGCYKELIFVSVEFAHVNDETVMGVP